MSVADPKPAPIGTVHDLGYKRYVGTRRPQSTRWRVIALHHIRQAWKTFWRFKLPLMLAVLNTTVFAWLMSNEKIMWGMGRLFQGEPETLLLFFSYAGVGSYARITFIATMFVAVGTIAGDKQSGAFPFYFSRPVRTIDYVAGKIAGFWLLFAMILIGGPLILAGIRLGMYGEPATIVANLILLPKVILIGALAALAFASVPLAISSVVPNRRYALALWAAYYLVFGTIAVGISQETGAWFASALDIPSAIQAMGYWLFDIKVAQGRPMLALPYAIGGLVAQSALAIGILYLRIARARVSGVGVSG